MSSPFVSPLTSPASSEPAGCNLRIVALDFATRTERAIAVADIPSAFAEGAFAWIDVDFADPEAARATLSRLALIGPEIVDDALTREAATQCARHDDYLHFVPAADLPVRRVRHELRAHARAGLAPRLRHVLAGHGAGGGLPGVVSAPLEAALTRY
jgi:hypothetical protein